MKKIALTSICLTAALTLTACGDSAEAYCNDLENAESQFKAFDDGDIGAFEEAFDAFDDLADQAPSEVEDDWKTLQEAMDKLEGALDDAGMTLADLELLGAGELPDGVTESDVMQLGEQLEELDDDKYTEAGDAIQKHAEDECGIELGS